MIGLVARLLGGLVTPLLDQVSAATARLIRKLAYILVAAVAFLVVLVALTMAFELWVASKAGHIAGTLAVAGLYLTVGLVCLWLGLRGEKPRPSAQRNASGAQPHPAEAAATDERIDTFAQPLLAILQRLGLRREQLAVLAGTSVAKQLGPIPLVGLAIVAGFLIGRLGSRLRDLLRADAIASLLSSDLLAAFFRPPPDDRSEA